MALLQVHQAKALKQLHEGGADPGVLQELCTATDLALRATKVTVRALGQTMSTLVVQERHLWLTLADMREADKHRFLDSRLLVTEGALLLSPPPLQLGHSSSFHNGHCVELAAGKQRSPPPPLPSL